MCLFPSRQYIYIVLWKASLDDMILHGLVALRETIGSAETLKPESCSIAIVGVDRAFEILPSDEVVAYVIIP